MRGAVERHPELIVGRRAILLHVAAGTRDERRERRILIRALRRPVTLDQHGAQRRLEGGCLPRLGALGERGGRLVKLDARQRTRRLRQHSAAAPAKTQSQSRNSKPADEGVLAMM